MSCLDNANSGQLLTMAVAFSAALAHGQSQTQLAKLGAFFTIVGDTLALYALEPNQTSPATSQAQTQQEVDTEAAISSALNLRGNL